MLVVGGEVVWVGDEFEHYWHYYFVFVSLLLLN